MFATPGTAQIATVASSVQTYTDPGLQEGHFYCYRVRAFVYTAERRTLPYYADTASAPPPKPGGAECSAAGRPPPPANIGSPGASPGPLPARPATTTCWKFTKLGHAEFRPAGTYPDGDRATPYSQQILADNTDIGQTTYWRWGLANGHMIYSNVVSVQVPNLLIRLYPDYDNCIALGIPEFCTGVPKYGLCHRRFAGGHRLPLPDHDRVQLYDHRQRPPL